MDAFAAGVEHLVLVLLEMEAAAGDEDRRPTGRAIFGHI
jgi:hypothetical protein